MLYPDVAVWVWTVCCFQPELSCVCVSACTKIRNTKEMNKSTSLDLPAYIVHVRMSCAICTMLLY